MDKVDISVACEGDAFWVAIDKGDVAPSPPQHSLPKGDHFLLWSFEGKPGQKISIKVTRGDEVLVSVKASKIRDDAIVGGGSKLFRS